MPKKDRKKEYQIKIKPYFTETKQNVSKSTKKWPDAIGFGVPKAGTGSLSFLDCHVKTGLTYHFDFRGYFLVLI